jgi:hypothetical protein
MAQFGRVWLPDDQFTQDFLLPELLSFPAGKHDDQVDCLAMAANRIREGGQGKAPVEEDEPVPPRSRKGLGLPGIEDEKRRSGRGGLERRSAFRR